MSASDYTSTVRGSLKLKGSAPVGVKKKKGKSSSSTSKSKTPSTSTSTSEVTTTTTSTQKAPAEEDTSTSPSPSNLNPNPTSNSPPRPQSKPRFKNPRTDIQRWQNTLGARIRRDATETSDRIAREGPKTHKQRVEELNKYLSTLSEHHDMPRIGPG
ncbi:Protein FAM32A [Lachnellula hyalina]|uniref:Protein FAM32A n=1 Tax=Lachnellula hyalina TaxID=1316788 RepID=A0A8H8R372_9HELO|nr:Protein FAM32A [Lachnellula hyalina]TVY27211.1 Protein FAM32A [Lachnellula hyalina]